MSLVRHWSEGYGRMRCFGMGIQKMVTPDAKRNAVAHLMNTHQVSQRRLCDILHVDRSTVRYQFKKVDVVVFSDAIKRGARAHG